VRVPGRTGLVVVALAASVGLMVQTAGVIRSNEKTILDWLDTNLTADLIVTSGGPFTASGQNPAMKLDLRDNIQETCPGTKVVAVSFLNTTLASHGKQTTILVMALDARTYFEANKSRRPVPTRLELFAALAEQPGTAVVSENFSQLHGLGVGDQISVEGVEGPVSMRIIGTLEDYSWNRGTVFIHRDHYQRALDLKLADVFDLFLPADLPDKEEARQRLQQSPWAAEHALFALTRGELREQVASMIERVYGLAYSQEVVLGIVAILGVVTALMISVLQRRRELGLLRAVGASQVQVLRSVLAEAVLMGVIGTLLGFGLGILLQWYVVQVIMLEEAGFAFPVRVPWGSTGTIAGITILCATLAGLGPALQALRVRIAEAIAYE
jgi:putative ABC transport system permease protein